MIGVPLFIATLIDSRSPNFTASLRFTYVGSRKPNFSCLVFQLFSANYCFSSFRYLPPFFLYLFFFNSPHIFPHLPSPLSTPTPALPISISIYPSPNLPPPTLPHIYPLSPHLHLFTLSPPTRRMEIPRGIILYRMERGVISIKSCFICKRLQLKVLIKP